jgi:hypothetical protein
MSRLEKSGDPIKTLRTESELRDTSNDPTDEI